MNARQKNEARKIRLAELNYQMHELREVHRHEMSKLCDEVYKLSHIRYVGDWAFRHYGSDHKSFDYVRAFLELAWPSYQALPENIRDLVLEAVKLTEELGQKKNLNMPWPDDDGGSLRSRFREIPAEFLSQAARVVHHLGHWKPQLILAEGQERPEFDTVVESLGKAGGCWKFSNLADQILHDKCGLEGSMAEQKNNTVRFKILEGMFRLCAQTRDTWMGKEVYRATPDRLAAARKIIAKVLDKPEATEADISINNLRDGLDKYEEVLEALLAEQSDFERRWTTVCDKYIQEPRD